MRTYSLYLSTVGINSPSNKTNLAQLKWSINWKEIFGDRVGECRVRVRFLTDTSPDFTWNNNVGSLRASFQTNFSNNTNGLNVAAITPKTHLGQEVEPFLEADSTGTNGVSMIIPNSNTELYITCLNMEETFMLNMENYIIFFYFDVDT